MKKFVPPGLVIIVLFAILAISTPNPVKAQNAGLISSILSRMERNRSDLKSLRADISMLKYDARIRDSDK